VLLEEQYGRRIRWWGKVDLKRIEGRKGQYKARIMRKGYVEEEKVIIRIIS
jgi:hypothetical protein